MFFACLTIVFLIFPHQYYARYPHQQVDKYAYESREVLAIGDVTSDNHFETGRGVFQWESVTIGNENYAVGLMERGITVFTAEISSNGSISVRNKTDLLSKKIIDVELIKHWNSSTKSYEVTVLLAVENSTLEWYQISNNLDLVQIWAWDTHKEITHINIFQIETSCYHLLILKRQKHFTADIYRIALSKSYGNQFWFSQMLPLRYIAKSSTFTVDQSNYFLSIPQNDNIHIFRYENNRFIAFTKVASAGVDSVDSFTIESKSYLLLNGANTGIYEFDKQGVTNKHVENTGMDGINFWLPIKLNTYKDEVVLLAQRILDHGNHKSKKLEVILSSGDKFYVHEEIPCRYYGDSLSGIDCLVEEENHNHSINGSAILLFDGVLGIVMPRKEGPSGLFLLSVKMKRVPNPIQHQMRELAALKDKLENMMQKRKESIRIIQSGNYPKEKHIDKDKLPSFHYGKPSMARTNEDHQFFEDMGSKIDELQRNLNGIKDILSKAVRRDAKVIEVKTLVLNDIAAVKADSKIKILKVTQINNTKTEGLFTDFVRFGDKKVITGEKTFTNLNVERIDATAINDVKISNMVFKNKLENLKLNGTLLFENMVEVQENLRTTSGNINDDIDLSKALSIDDNYKDEITFANIEANTIEANYVNKLQIHKNYIENVQMDFESYSNETHDSLYIPGDINVQNINGENLRDILDSIVMKNEYVIISGNIVINGDVNVTGDAVINYLNSNKFPEEYIFQDLNSTIEYIEFLGNKHFDNLIRADEVTALAGINGVDTDTIITLTDSQSIPGLVTFTDFNPTGYFDVQGNISGVPDISPHPTIIQSNILNCDVSFENLEVEGTLIIGNLINGTHLEQILEDIVLKDEEEVTITSIKDFQKGLTIEGDLQLESNTINGVSLNSYVDKISEQVLKIDVLNGSVTFENLHISGYFGGINISQLNEETVKISGNQFISSTLHFLDDLTVSGDFYIENLLNDVAPDFYVFNTGDRFLPSLNKLGRVQVDTLIVEGDLNGKVDNFDVEDFNKNRLSLTRDQTITGKYFINNLQLDDLDANWVNNYEFKELMGPEKYKSLIEKMILANNIKIKVLDIMGNISIEGINNVNMGEILKACIYQGGNQLAPTITFSDDVEFARVIIENLNSVPFAEFMANLIFKNATNVTLYGDSIFEKGFEVDGFIETETVNGVAVENVLRKSGNQKIFGPIIIIGNISIDDTAIGENLNGVPMRYLSEVFEVVNEHTYKITGDVVFEGDAHIDELFTQHSINDKYLPKFLEEVIRINDDATIPGVTHFNNKVQINGNIGVMNKINDVDLSSFFENVVLATHDTYIQGLVSFAHPVVITKEVFIETDLWSETIMGIDVKEWLTKAVFINKGFIAGELTFDSVTVMESLNVDFVNSINLSALIPLRTNQHLPEDLYVKEMSVTREIIVDNLVNGVRLDLEYPNTLLNEGKQEVFSDMEFTTNVVVYHNFDATGLVNTVNLSRIVTTNTDQNLSATYHFHAPVLVHSNLQVSGTVNNINIVDWNVNALKKRSNDVQNIEGPLFITRNVTFTNNVAGNGDISGLNIEDVARTVEIRKQFKETREKQLRDEYGATCDSVNELLHKAKSQGYRFKYFDYFQVIEFAKDVGVVHNFHHENTHYMLVNEINSCKSSLFSWSSSGYILNKKDIETGMVLQFLTVKDKKDALYLIARSEPYATTCLIEGTNVWKFGNQWDILLYEKLEDLSLIQESKIPGTFYGFTKAFTYEFKIIPHSNFQVHIMRNWTLDSNVRTENLAFMPNKLGTGLSLRDGHSIFKLLKENTISGHIQDDNTEEISIEDIHVETNSFVPGRNDSEFIVFKVGKYRTRTMAAVIEKEETTIKGKSDVIKIYEDILTGKIFHKITAYKPSSLIAIDFHGNGETLLIFIEDEKVMQVYEYKGLEGFKLRSSIKEEGQKLISLSLPFLPHNKRRNVLAMINHNKLTLIRSVMEGNFIDEDYLKCSLQ